MTDSTFRARIEGSLALAFAKANPNDRRERREFPDGSVLSPRGIRGEAFSVWMNGWLDFGSVTEEEILGSEAALAVLSGSLGLSDGLRSTSFPDGSSARRNDDGSALVWLPGLLGGKRFDAAFAPLPTPRLTPRSEWATASDLPEWERELRRSARNRAALLTAARARFERLPNGDVRASVPGESRTFSWEKEDFVGRGSRSETGPALSAVLDSVAFAWSRGAWGIGLVVGDGPGVALETSASIPGRSDWLNLSIARSADGTWSLVGECEAAERFGVWTDDGFLPADPSLVLSVADAERRDEIEAENGRRIREALG